MAMWHNTYPGLDAALHELASTLTSLPNTQDDKLAEVAAAVRSFYSNEITGSSFKFDGWSEPASSQRRTGTGTASGDDPTSEQTDTTAKSTTTTQRR